MHGGNAPEFANVDSNGNPPDPKIWYQYSGNKGGISKEARGKSNRQAAYCNKCGIWVYHGISHAKSVHARENWRKFLRKCAPDGPRPPVDLLKLRKSDKGPTSPAPPNQIRPPARTDPSSPKAKYTRRNLDPSGVRRRNTKQSLTFLTLAEHRDPWTLVCRAYPHFRELADTFYGKTRKVACLFFWMAANGISPETQEQLLRDEKADHHSISYD